MDDSPPFTCVTPLNTVYTGVSSAVGPSLTDDKLTFSIQ